MDSLAAAHDAAVQMIDTSIVRVHQHAACIARNRSQSMGRSLGGLTLADPMIIGPLHQINIDMAFMVRVRSIAEYRRKASARRLS
jgi:hypothetical protein